MNRKVVVLIPARLDSKRFPGKSMYKIGGFPLVCWTYTQARMTGYLTVVVTPDEEIRKDLFLEKQIPTVLTSDRPINGTERCWEAIQHKSFVSNLNDEDIIINVQGDLLKYDYQVISEIVNLLDNPDVDFATTFSVYPDKNLGDMNKVKCAIRYVAPGDRIVMSNFNREAIPYERNMLHIGIYGFKKKSLETYFKLSPTENELSMSLEQMRIIDNDLLMYAVPSLYPPIAIDSRDDLIFAEKELKEQDINYMRI